MAPSGAAAAGPAVVGTLQSSLDEPRTAGGGIGSSSKQGGASSGQAADVIRAMLREQKRECATLHANPLMKQLAGSGRRGEPGAGALAAAQQCDGAGCVPGPPPRIEDLDAEGAARLLDTIRRAASDRQPGTPCCGVWASFGKPYACLGELQQLDSSAAALLPRLNRDELRSARQPRAPQHPRQQRGAATTTGALAAAGGGSKQQQQQQEPGAGGTALRRRAGSKGGGVLSSEGEAGRLLHHKTIIKFTTLDRLEAGFPAAAVKQANARAKASRSQPRKFFNRALAAADLADAAASCGRHELPLKQLPGKELLRRHQAAAAGAAGLGAAPPAPLSSTWPPAAAAAAADGGAQAFFITQRAAAGQAAVPGSGAARLTARSLHQLRLAQPAEGTAAVCSSEPPSPRGHRPVIAVARATARASVTATAADLQQLSDVQLAAGRSSLSMAAAAAEPSHAGSSSNLDAVQPCQPSAFEPLTELVALQQPGAPRNPVPGWHNEFLKVRQAGYTELQAALWQRSNERAAARSHPAAQAQLSRGLMQALDLAHGQLARCCGPGQMQPSPFSAARQRSATAAPGGGDEAAAAASGGPRAPEAAEVELAEHFHAALSSLVVQQHLSDPLSLWLVQAAKQLLESGAPLAPPLLQQLLAKLASEFVRGCGLQRFNRFAAPLLGFAAACVGVAPAALRAMAADAGLGQVLYEDQQERAADTAGAAGAAAAGPGTQAAADAAAARNESEAATPAGAGAVASTPRGAAPRASGARSMGGSMRFRASSRLEPPGTAASMAPTKPGIDAAAATAAAEIAATVRSAALAAAVGEGAAAKVRVPGVAGLVDVMPSAPQHAAADDASGTAGRCSSSNSRSSSLSSSSSLMSSSSLADAALLQGSSNKQAAPDS